MPMDDLLANVLQQYDTPVEAPKENTFEEVTLPEMSEQSAESVQIPQMEQLEIAQEAIEPLPQMEVEPPSFMDMEPVDALQGAIELDAPEFDMQAQPAPQLPGIKPVPFQIPPIPKTPLNVPKETYKPQIETDDAYTDYTPIVWT